MCILITLTWVLNFNRDMRVDMDCKKCVDDELWCSHQWEMNVGDQYRITVPFYSFEVHYLWVASLTVMLQILPETTGAGDCSRATHNYPYLGGTRPYVCAVWDTGTSHLVGVFMGHHGACDILCYIRHSHGSIRILCCDKAGNMAGHCVFTLLGCSSGMLQVTGYGATSVVRCINLFCYH